MSHSKSMSKISILRKIQEKKSGGFVIENKITDDTVAEVIKGKEHKFINISEKSQREGLEIDNEQYIIEPYIPLKDRFEIVITGQSGSGKTTLAFIFALQYQKRYPKNKIYIISQKDFKKDQNLKNLRATQLQPVDLQEDDKYIESLSDSLIIFDDNDTRLKEVSKFINKVTEIGRSMHISYVFISHVHSKRGASLVYNELDMYICFKSGLASNRMLKNLEVKMDTIDFLKEKPSAFICFNFDADCIITDKFIFKK